MAYMHIERYRRARERLLAARQRGEDADQFEVEMDSLWATMNAVDRRTILLGDEQEGEKQKPAA